MSDNWKVALVGVLLLMLLLGLLAFVTQQPRRVTRAERLQIAAQVLSGLEANPDPEVSSWPPARAARVSLAYADALIAAEARR